MHVQSQSMMNARAELLSCLTCPETREPLRGWDGESETGTLTATESGKTYPVRGGIACLLPEALQESAAAEFAEKRAEMSARDAQVGDYDAMLGLRLFTAAEVPLTLSYLRLEPSHLLLEGGCGTGRMTPFFADRVRGLLCVDFSMASLRVARAKLSAAQAAKTLFVQADLSQLPVRSDVFDRVGTFGVYEHIPTEAARDRAVGELMRVLLPPRPRKPVRTFGIPLGRTDFVERRKRRASQRRYLFQTLSHSANCANYWHRTFPSKVRPKRCYITIYCGDVNPLRQGDACYINQLA